MPVRLQRTCARLLAAIVVLAAGAVGSPAAAHTDLLSISPADGDRLEQLPRELVLEFSETMDPGLGTIVLEPDQGRPTKLTVRQGETRQVLVADVPASVVTDPGVTSWRIAYRVVSRDGHPVAGESSFTVRTAATPSPTPSETAEESPTETPTETTSASPAAGVDAGGDADPDPEADGSTSWVPIGVGAGVLAVLVLAVGVTMWRVRRDPDE